FAAARRTNNGAGFTRREMKTHIVQHRQSAPATGVTARQVFNFQNVIAHCVSEPSHWRTSAVRALFASKWCYTTPQPSRPNTDRSWKIVFNRSEIKFRFVSDAS